MDVRLTTIGEVAADLGINPTTFRRKAAKAGLLPTVRIPHTPLAKGYTPAEVERVRRLFARDRLVAAGV